MKQPQEPDQYTISEESVRKWHKNVTTATDKDGKLIMGVGEWPNADDFVNDWIGGDRDKLLSARAKIIENYEGFTEMTEGGDPDSFMGHFLKKKDPEPAVEKQSDITPEKSPTPSPTGTANSFDLALYDFENQTDLEKVGMGYYTDSYNHSKALAELRNEEIFEHIAEEEVKMGNDISNIIAEKKPEFKMSMKDAPAEKTLDNIRGRTGMLDYFKETEEAASAKVNPGGHRGTDQQIRQMVIGAHMPEFMDNFNSDVEEAGATPYDVVTSPVYMDRWEKKMKHSVPGETFDMMHMEIQTGRDNVILDNESQIHFKEEVAEIQRRGISYEDASKQVLNKIEADKWAHFEANTNKKSLKRAQVQNELEAMRRNPRTTQAQLANKEAELSGLGENLFDEHGRVIHMSEVEETREKDTRINDRIGELIMDVSTFKGDLEKYHHDKWMIYRNLVRLGQKRGAEMAEKMANTHAPGIASMMTLEEKSRGEHLDYMIREAKLDVDATGRMLFANENIALSGNKKGKHGFFRFYAREFVDELAAHNKFIFSDPTKDKSTPAKELEVYKRAKQELGYSFSKEEEEAMDIDFKLHLTREGAAWTDILGKLFVLNTAAGALGISEAIAGISSQVMRYGTKGGLLWDEASFGYRSAENTIKHLVGATEEGVKFSAVGGDFQTGFAFYGAGTLFGGIKPIGLGNKYVNQIANTLIKGPATMTASFEAVAGVTTSLNALSNDRRIADDIYDMFGDTNALQKRVATEWLLGGFMGSASMMGGKARGLFRFNEQYLEQLAQLAERKGRLDVARDIRNFQYKTSEVFEANRRGDDAFNKFEFLTKKNTYTEAELLIYNKNKVGKPEFNYEKIDVEFDKVIEGDLKKFEEVVGPGSWDVLKRKMKVMEKLGLDKGSSPGEVINSFDRNVRLVDKKWVLLPGVSTGRKVSKTYNKELYKDRKSKIKETEKTLRFDPATGAIVEDSEQNKKSEKSDITIKGEERMEFEASYRQAERDLSSVGMDSWKADYLRTSREGWEVGPEGKRSRSFSKEAWELTNELAAKTGHMIRLLEEGGMTETTHYKELVKSNAELIDHVNKGTYFSNAKAIEMTDKVTDSLNAFRTQNMRNNITGVIESHLPVEGKKRGPSKEQEQMSPEATLFVEVADIMFNKAEAERLAKNGATEGEIARGEQLLERLNGTSRNVIENRAESMAKDPTLWENHDNSIYEGAKEALNYTTRSDALRKRTELEELAGERKLTEAEQITYDLLEFADGYRMPSKALAHASTSLSSIILKGKSRHKANEQHKTAREHMMKFGVAEMLNPKNVDVTTKQILDPADFTKQLNKFQKGWKGGRGLVESFPTLMEMLQSRTPGNKPFQGGLHSWSNRALVAEIEQTAEQGYWSKTLMDEIVIPVFGSGSRGVKKMNSWAKESRVQLTLNGEPKELTTSAGEVMRWYAYSRMPSEAPTFSLKGFKMNADGTISKQAIGELKAELKRIGGQQAIDYVHAVTGNLLPRMGSRVDSRHVEDNGVNMTQSENYFPRTRMEMQPSTFKDVREAGDVMRDHQKFVDTGVTKEITGSMEWYKEGDFNDVLYDYMQSSTHYIHYQGFINDMASTWGDPTVQKTVENNYGKRANQIIEKMTSDLAAGRAGGNRVEVIDKGRMILTRAALGVKPMLIPKQLMSTNAYQAEMSPTEAIEWMYELAKPNLKTKRELLGSRELNMRYAYDAWNKELSGLKKKYALREMKTGSDIDKLKLIKGKGFDAFAWKNLKDNFLLPTKVGDLGAIIEGGTPFYIVRKRTYEKQGLSPAEAHQRAYNDFYEATRRTQQSGNLMDLSHVQRGGSIGGLTTLFLNSPMQYLRGEMGAVTNMYEGFRQGDAAKVTHGFKNLLIYQYILPMTFQMAQSGFYLGRDDKWYDEMLEDPTMLSTFILGSFKGAPLLGGAAEAGISQFVTGHNFPWMKTILGAGAEDWDAFVEFTSDMIHRIGEQGMEPIEVSNIIEAGAELLGLTGFPTSGMYNIGEGIADKASGATDNFWAPFGLTEWSRGEAQNKPHYMKEIRKFLPEKIGETVDNAAFMDHMHQKMGDKWYVQNLKRASTLFDIYSKYGEDDKNVNMLMFGLYGGRDKAAYILDLHKAHVQDMRLIKGKLNPRREVGLKDVMGDIKMNDSDFYWMVYNWMADGIITPDTYVQYTTMLNDNYEMFYQWKLPEE